MKGVNRVLLLLPSSERFCSTRGHVVRTTVGDVSCEGREDQEIGSSPWLPTPFSLVSTFVERLVVHARDVSCVSLLRIMRLREHLSGLYSRKMSLEIVGIMIERVKIVVINFWRRQNFQRRSLIRQFSNRQFSIRKFLTWNALHRGGPEVGYPER